MLKGDQEREYLAKAYGMGYLHLEKGTDTDSVIEAFLKDPDESMILECEVDPDELA